MRKLAKNQRVRIKTFSEEDNYGYHIFKVIVLEQKGRIFWKRLVYERLPENFGYNCSEEVMNMLINSLLLSHEDNLLYQKMKDQQESKMKNFKKCLKTI